MIKLLPIAHEKFPFLVIDNFYSDEELEKIWKEIDFLGDKARPEDRVVAKKDGKSLASVKRVYLDSLYTNRDTSNILSIFPTRLYCDEIGQTYQELVPSGVNFNTSNYDATQLSYYENKDGYKAHTDVFQHTALTWIFKQPKKFEGGDLIFTQSKMKAECMYNRTIIFPSWYYHAVSEIKMKEENLNKGLGRWAITHFINFRTVALETT